MVPFFQVWSIKQILALFLFSASAYYRANWINNAAIWMSECGLYVLCVCVCVCQVTFIYIALLTIQIVTKQLHTVCVFL